VHDALQLETCPKLFPLFVWIVRFFCRFLGSEKSEDFDLGWYGWFSFDNLGLLDRLALWKRLNIDGRS